ncbi:hypothetical protein N7457_003219 [Penicillium paradoxum]|uniref:uncharacterized protein n=1 Tax=Penicillium paradoxum TaxID=176176 RepID=UPI00254819FB|nr:uncharacterized protein N7457_003219 [Penicillium paradoxum]KAJ5788229.1 hypothetical protein N7457_003219 [Penicillium paradoxum]
MSNATHQLRQKLSMTRLLNPRRSIFDYTGDSKAFVIPGWILVPPEVRDAMLHLEYRATVAIFSMKSLMVMRDSRYFEMCPSDKDSASYKMHKASMQRLLEWKEDWDILDPTLATSAKIPRESLRFCVDSIAYGRYISEYTTRIDLFMSGPYQHWRQMRIEVEHLAFRLMGHKKHEYEEWRTWWDGKFANDMWEWDSCLEGLVLPLWEEVVDDVYLMIKDRVEEPEGLARSFHISGPSSASVSPN